MENTKEWTEKLSRAIGFSPINLQQLCEDGSTRKYSRFNTPEGPRLLMQVQGRESSALQEGVYEWLVILQTLQKYKIYTPTVYQLIPSISSLVIEDCGDELLETRIRGVLDNKNSDKKNILSIYRPAFQMIGRFLSIKKIPSELWCTRSFDEAKLQYELNFFAQHALSCWGKSFLSKEEKDCFFEETKKLCSHISQVPKYFVHRDFHSRNLIFNNHHLYVIDFQDARLGPAAYDLVSLCFDPYVDLTSTDRFHFFSEALQMLSETNGKNVKDEILSSWQAVFLQRQLKAIGSFFYLSKIKNRDYTPAIQPALGLLRDLITPHPDWPFLSSVFIQKLDQGYKDGLTPTH